jgi:PAS domain S-box-containing protein
MTWPPSGFLDDVATSQLLRRLKAVTDHVALALFMMDERQHCTFMNPAAERMTGYTLPDVQGRPLHEVIHHTRPDGRPYPREECPIGRVFLERSPREGEEVFVRRDGTFYPVMYTASPIVEHGGPVGTIIEVRDITREKHLRNEKQRLLEREQAANRTKDEFLAMLAHELRNPLGVILNGMGVLEQGGGSSRTYVLIRRQVQHLARLLDDLLDVARIGQNKIELRTEPVDLRSVVEQALEGLRHLVESKRQSVKVEVPSEPVYVIGDRARLEQVVGNLVNNAWRYTPVGGSIAVTVLARDDRAVLRVRDTGVGIEPDRLDAIFELFTQLNPTLARTEGGLGVGLTLVKRLVSLHGGTVRAHSEGPDRGSEFEVTLPRAQGVRVVEPTPSPPRPVAARRILVIEDNDDAREMLALSLRLHGHATHEARSGREGVAVAERVAPDVVLVDIGLPDLDGYEVGRQLRALLGRRAFLLAITGYGQPEDRRRTEKAGFDVHLVKPVHPDAIQELLVSGAGV